MLRFVEQPRALLGAAFYGKRNPGTKNELKTTVRNNKNCIENTVFNRSQKAHETVDKEKCHRAPMGFCYYSNKIYVQ